MGHDDTENSQPPSEQGLCSENVRVVAPYLPRQGKYGTLQTTAELVPANWKTWLQRYDLFAIASGVGEKSEKVECMTFLCVAGGRSHSSEWFKQERDCSEKPASCLVKHSMAALPVTYPPKWKFFLKKLMYRKLVQQEPTKDLAACIKNQSPVKWKTSLKGVATGTTRENARPMEKRFKTCEKKNHFTKMCWAKQPEEKSLKVHAVEFN